MLSIPMNSVDMIVPLGGRTSNIGGLEEFGYRHFHSKDSKKPYLACPEKLWDSIEPRLDYGSGFQQKFVKKIGFKEEHITETLTFVTYVSGSYGFHLEKARIFCAGPDSNAGCDENILSTLDCDIILHRDSPDLQTLPVYLQRKIWLYGYPEYTEGTDPVPMLYIPQGSVIYDSDRRDKIMNKERFIRENSKRILGNEAAK